MYCDMCLNACSSNSDIYTLSASCIVHTCPTSHIQSNVFHDHEDCSDYDVHAAYDIVECVFECLKCISASSI